MIIPFFSFVLVPLIDNVIGRDTENFSEETYKKLEKNQIYNLLLCFLFFGVLGSLYFSLVFTQFQFLFTKP